MEPTTVSGTSASTAIVTSVIDMMRSIDPELNSERIITALKKTSDDLGDKGKDMYYGYALTNYESLIRYIRNLTLYEVYRIIH